MSKRGTFEAFEKEAIALFGNESYLVSRNRKKKHQADGSTTEITQESCHENIRRIFIEIIDNIFRKQNHCLRKDFYKVVFFQIWKT